MSEMRATRGLLRRVEAMAGFYRYSDGFFRLGREARAELVAMERVVEAARARWAAEGEEAYYSDREDYGAASRAGERAEAAAQELDEALAALAELDGQTERGTEGPPPAGTGTQDGLVARRPTQSPAPRSVCPCGVHGDPDGDCGENCP